MTELSTGLRVEYENAPSVDVALYGWSAIHEAPRKLVPGPISSDPRVRLNTKAASGADDPSNKQAVLIAPFASRRTPNGRWTAMLREGVVKFLGGNPGRYESLVDFKWQGDAEKLSKHGYSVETAIDSEATLTRIVQILGGRSLRAPGVVIFYTHGMGNGDIATGVDLGHYRDRQKVQANFEAAIREIVAFAPDFATFEGGTEKKPKTVTTMSMAYNNNEYDGDTFLLLTPAFWRWLAAHNVRFDKSLVYIAACSTDETPDLRTAISARAYLAWASSPTSELAGSIANYLVDSLTRPTHTAEEAYYNIARIVTTGQRIFDEDQDLDDVFGQPFVKGWGFTLNLFHGYGWNGSTLVPYATSGWLDGKMNPGSVWWLLFAARWDATADGGAAALANCQSVYWGPEERPGVQQQFCNAAEPGGKPSLDEVAYAAYVLTGRQVLPYSRTLVPRMTLVDGEQ